jgi:hypothetical protein
LFLAEGVMLQGLAAAAEAAEVAAVLSAQLEAEELVREVPR